VETCLYVSDVARSRAFYERVFGFDAMGGDERFVPLNVREGQVLILFRRGGTLSPIPVADSFIPPHDGSGAQHFAFGIHKDVIGEWKDWLEQQDIDIESVVEWPQGGTSLYFRDPDGLLVELITRGVWKNYQ